MYARLGLDSSHGGGGGRASAREQEDDLELVGGGGAGEPFVIKVIYRETSREVVPPMTPTSTVGSLRAAASEMFDVELERVRLIQGGKILAPDSASLKSLHLVSGTSVHLFPKVNPAAAASAGAGALPVATAASLQVAPTPTNDAAPALPFFHVDPAATLENLHIDPLVAQTCREVRLWSLILFFLSSMSIVNNLSELSNTGRLGSSKLDTIVLWLETACSVLGIYTAQLGLVSARTADLGAVSRYVKALTATALLCIAYRVVWTVDVVIEVKRILSMGAVALGSTQGGGGGGAGAGAGAGPGASPGSGGSNSGPAGAGAKSSVQQLGGDDDGIAQASKDRILETYTLRAVMVALVCIGCWVSCWLRGVRLRLLLQAYSDSVAVPPTATATAVTNPIARVAAVGAAEQA